MDEGQQKLLIGIGIAVVCVILGVYAYNTTKSSGYRPTQQDISSMCQSGVQGALEHLEALHGDSAIQAVKLAAASMDLGSCGAEIQQFRITVPALTFNAVT